MTAARQRLHDAALDLFAARGSSEVTVSELATAAGIARGTVYNNIDSLDDFFDQVSRDLAIEMRDRMQAAFVDVRDPAVRLSDGLRFFVRRAHEQPGWGRFVARFGPIDPTVRQLWAGPPMDDVRAGRRKGRFTIGVDDEPGAMALVNGTTITAMWQVLEAHETWRRVGSSGASLVLRALGITADEADRIARAPLRALATVDPDHPDPDPSSATTTVPTPTTAPTSTTSTRSQEPS